MNKKIVSLALASTMVLSSASMAFAANLDVLHRTNGTRHSFNQVVRSASVLRDVATASENYLIEFNKEYYSVEAVKEKTEAGLSFEEAIAELEPVEIEVPGQGELEVVEVSAINKTSIVVKLNGAVEEELTADFFNVTGATVTSIEPGAASDRYVLNINSLDGKSGTVTVNGKSASYNFVAEAKAAVESVTFDNYRQFRVTFNEEVDELTATNPANYYFEIVEGQAGKLGAAGDITGNQSLADINGIGNWFDFIGTTNVRDNITAKTVNGKTVVTINLPGDTRLGNGTLNIINGLGYTKALDKDVTVHVAVRNVKDASGVRNIDTSVFPMLINDSERPELVTANKYKLVSDTRVEAVEFNPVNTTTVEVEANALTKVLELEFSEPVYDATSVIVYVNGEVAPVGSISFEGLATASDYEDAKLATLDVETAITAAKFVPSNEVHNIKIVGVKDLADNITIPSAIEFNVKVVQEANFASEKPEVLGIQQIADNMFEIEWNRAKAIADFEILKPDGTTDVANASIDSAASTEVASGARKGRFFSVITVNAIDAVDTGDTVLAYDGQNFINRTFKITSMTTTDVPPVPNTGATYEESVRLYKDIQAPVLDELIIQGEPDTYQEVEAGSPILELSMKDVTPFGSNAIENDVVVMKADGTAAAAAGDSLKPLRVSYEKDGIVRSAEIVLTGAEFATNVLTIDLSAKTSLLNKDGELVEGATYKVEIPEGFFADPGVKVTVTPGNDQEFVDSNRAATYGFTSLKVTADVTVPGEIEEVVGDTVPQTAKRLITSKYEDSVRRDEISIEFKGAIDPATLKNPSNYTLNGKTLAAWGLTSSDIEYVVTGADLDDPATQKFARFYAPAGSVSVTGEVEITVENVANFDGAKMAPVTTTLSLRDNKAPRTMSSELEGAKNILITFDEPLVNTSTDANAAKNFAVTVDGTKISVETATVSGRTITLVLSQNIDNAEASIEVEVVEDNNGNLFIEDAAGNKLVEGTIIEVQ